MSTQCVRNFDNQKKVKLTHIVPKKVLTKKVWSPVALQPLNQTVPVLSKGTSTNIYLSYKKKPISKT